MYILTWTPQSAPLNVENMITRTLQEDEIKGG